MGDNVGITGGIDTTLPIAMTISGFSAVAFYNALELNIMIWMTFKRHSGIYFWSLLASSWGIVIYQLAFLMKFFQVWTNNYVSVAFITIGWYAMVTGQSLVLYSRLHLVVHDRRKIRWVLYMILIDVVLFHFPTTVMTFGANSNMAATFTLPYSIMEKIQVTAFCIQEFIISGLYLYETRRILKPSATFQKKRTRQVMMHLIYVNVLIILMDITLLGMEYADLYDIQITFKGALYSIKLRLEFAVLNQLMSLTQGHIDSGDNPNAVYSHSGARGGVAMQTFDGEAHADSGDGKETNGHSYTVYAGRAIKSPFEGAIDDGRVMKTTDIAVTTELAQQSDNETEKGHESDSGNRTNRPRAKASPTSSEVEFAAAGF